MLSNLDAVVVWRLGIIECVLKLDLAVHDLFVDDAAWGDLAEHLERIEPRVDSLQTDCLIDGGNGDTLDVDDAAVGFSGDLLSFARVRVSISSSTNNKENLLVEPHVVILHGSPVPPLERHSRRATVDLQYFPRKSWHHALEGLVTGSEVRVLRAVELIRCDYSIVGTDLEHVLGGLRRSTIDGKRVVLVVDGSPV